MIPFSPIDSTICTVKNWYVIGREAFTIRNKTATMNNVVNNKSRAAIDENGDDAFKIICLFFGVIWNNLWQFFKLSLAVDTVQITNTQNFCPVGFHFFFG